MKIALTGGTGFVGSHFIKKALADGHTVLAIRRSLNSQPRIPLDMQPIWLDRRLDRVSSDDLEGCDAVVHLAAHTANMPYDLLVNCLRWNLIAVINLFEQARLAGIKRFIVAGSCFEYGRSGERYSEIPSNAPLEPTNSYAASKAIASIALMQWAEEHKLSLEILRIFHVFGEGELETRFFPSLKRAALAGENFSMTKGEQIRDFQLVQSVALAFLDRAIATSKEPGYANSFNLSSSNYQSIKEFAQEYWKVYSASGTLKIGALPYREHEVMRLVPGPNYYQISSQ